MMNNEEILAAVEKARKGVDQYLKIMGKFKAVDVSSDREFQRLFNHFYRIRRRSSEWYVAYYNLLEASKSCEPRFERVLCHIHDALGRWEASFASKLVATVDPNQPVWDAHVLKNLGKLAPRYGDPKRMEKIIDLYREIQKWYRAELASDRGRNIIAIFDRQIGEQPMLTDLKKIDFVLWQHRG